MNAELKVFVDDRGAIKYLKDVKGRFETKRRVFEGPVLKLLTDFFKQQFESEGAYGGYPWEPLKETTLIIKERLGYGDKGMLRREDELYEALTSTDRTAPGRVLKIGKDRFDFQITVAHAHIQNFGSKKSGKIPPRRILPPRGMPDSFLDGLQKRMVGYLLTGRIIEGELE